MEKIQERYALDRLGWFTHTELIYSKELSKKLREFQVKGGYVWACRFEGGTDYYPQDYLKKVATENK